MLLTLLILPKYIYRRLLVNPKTGGSRKSFIPANDFKILSAKRFMPTDPTKM